MNSKPSWTVLLLGGASGVGKSSISYRLAQHYGAGLTEIDDFQVILESMTTPEQYPVLHYWRTNFEEAVRMSPQEHVDFFRRYAEVMARALTPVIANHLETHTPVVLEGDFILPSLAAQQQFGEVRANGKVRAIFLYDDDEEQIARNYLLRDGTDQRERARISGLVGAWLRTDAERVGVVTLSARPWDTVFDRAVAAIDGDR